MKDQRPDMPGMVRRGVIVRLILGLTQMAGALLSILLFIETGLSPQAVTAAIATGCLTAFSRWIFRMRTEPGEELRIKTQAERS